MAAANPMSRNAGSSSFYINVNYQEESEKISDFLQKFEVTEETLAGRRRQRVAVKKYLKQLQAVADLEEKSVTIDLDDIAALGDDYASLVSNIERNTKRYSELFAEAIDTLLPESIQQINEESHPLDVIIHHIRQCEEQNREAAGPNAVAQQNQNRRLPPSLTRRYSVFFKPRTDDKQKPLAVRDVKGSHVGSLITVRGIVTRVSDVKCMIVVNTMSCDQCGGEVFQEVNSRQFSPLIECPSEECKRNGVKGKLYPQSRASKFLSFQEVKIQEMSDQVPMGHIPRTMTVHLMEGLVRTVNPGDVVHISGILVPQPYAGFRALRAGLLTDTFLEAQRVDQLKKQYSEMELTNEIARKIDVLARDPDVYSLLARSIAPEIWGHEDVKKALLLQLVGGVPKDQDGMKNRGDINVCLMGDPGVAKSQLLKYVSRVAPRGVYTTGRGSSGVGLTASVMRDPITNEMILEGGALVLSDQGVCCIDEFDKMDESDRTAIHEVMEQQTISISKAGITTTLNARTSILAAANPQFGRYNKKKKATENINLPAALLSRFDLLFLILDIPNMDDDLRLAQHVGYVHIHNTHPPFEGRHDVVSQEVMRHYIARARTYQPTVPDHVDEHLANVYVHMRQQSEELAEFTYVSPRTLLGLIRMGTALARLRFSDTVEIADIDEALRLMEVSKSSLRDESEVVRTDPITRIYESINELGRIRNYARLKYSEVLTRVKSKGYAESDLIRTLEQYESINILQRSSKGDYIVFVFNENEEDEDEEL